MPEQALFKLALNKAMAQCSRRELCCDNIHTKLLSWGIDDKNANKIIGTLIKENFINESRFAEAFVRDKFKYNKWGKVKIMAHLRAKKLSPEVINTALDSIDNVEYTKLLHELIESHRKSVKAKNQYDLKAKLLRFGLSKGFESSLLYDVLNDVEL